MPSVPPDLAAKGMTGDVVAGEIVDRITARCSSASPIPCARRNPSPTALAAASSWKFPKREFRCPSLTAFAREELGNNTHVGGAFIVPIRPEVTARGRPAATAFRARAVTWMRCCSVWRRRCTGGHSLIATGYIFRRRPARGSECRSSDPRKVGLGSGTGLGRFRPGSNPARNRA